MRARPPPDRGTAGAVGDECHDAGVVPLLADIVGTSNAVAATRARRQKTTLMAHLLRRLQGAPSPVPSVVTAFLAGDVRQRATGIGWASLRDLPPAAPHSILDVLDVDRAAAGLAAATGPGSRGMRTTLLAELFTRATAEEQDFLRRLLLGELRQGALDALVLEAWAAATETPLADVRRAAMLTGSVQQVAEVLARDGAEALRELSLQVGRPLLPMLASSAPSLEAALDGLSGGAVSVEEKIDGIRVQVHRIGGDVRVFSRSLDDLTTRLPEVVETVRALPATRLVLDGEAVALQADGRPHAFQDTAARTGSRADVATARARTPLTPLFFDLLHRDGHDLLDEPLEVRQHALHELVPEASRVRTHRVAPGDPPEDAAAFVARTLAMGHEGVVCKALSSAYEAGRRGASWVKVKPVHTLDLLVLGAEWGSGRRRGWLSNLHLGARDPDGGPPVMLGKTFKGMTDELLIWQTEALLARVIERHRWGVLVTPDLVVEIALDGVQRSSRYPGGVALRFARVVRYRPDKSPAEADTLAAVRALGAGPAAGSAPGPGR